MLKEMGGKYYRDDTEITREEYLERMEAIEAKMRSPEMIRAAEAEELRRKQAEYEASLIPDDFGNKYEQTIVNGKLALRLVESADGTLNI